MNSVQSKVVHNNYYFLHGLRWFSRLNIKEIQEEINFDVVASESRQQGLEIKVDEGFRGVWKEMRVMESIMSKNCLAGF